MPELPDVQFKTADGRNLSYEEASKELRHLLADRLDLPIERVSATITNISIDPMSPVADTLYSIHIDGADPTPAQEARVLAVLQTLSPRVRPVAKA